MSEDETKGQACSDPKHPGDVEYQVQQTFFASRVEPNAVSTIKLSGGKTIPYYFSLGINSTVPFVQLESAGGANKELSWGETIEVPPGQLVGVRNVSYMAGDIQIQSGKDYAPTPPRLQKFLRTWTEFPDLAPPASTVFRSDELVDLRRARRAYFTMDYVASTLGNTIVLLFSHTNKQHSSDYPYANGINFDTVYNIPPGTAMGLIPIGYQMSSMDVDSHVPQILGDFCNVTIQYTTLDSIDPRIDRPYIVVEYL